MFGIWDGPSGKSQSSPHTQCTQENAAGHTTPSTLNAPRAPVSMGSFLSCPQMQEREFSAALGAHPRHHSGHTRAQTPQGVASGGGCSWDPFPWNRNAGGRSSSSGGVNHPNGTPTLSGVWLKGLMVALVFLADPLHRLLHEPRQVLRPRRHRRRLQRPLGESSSLGPPNCQYSSKLTQPDESPAFPHQLPAGGKMERLGAGGGALGA